MLKIIVVKSDVDNVKSDVNDVKSDMNDVKPDVDNVKSDMNDVKSDMNDVKSDVFDNKERMDEFANVEAIGKEVNAKQDQKYITRHQGDFYIKI